MLIKFLLPFFILLVNIGCQKYPLSGNVNMTNSKLHPIVYLVDPINFGALASSFEGKVIDSASIDQHGNFRFLKMPTNDYVKVYVLTIQKPGEKYANRLENDDIDLSNYIPFAYGVNGNVIINTSGHHFLRDAAISGNIPENKDISILIKTRFQLAQKYLIKQDAVDESSLMAHEKAIYTYQHELMKSIEKNTNVAINALALRWVSPNGDYERAPEFVKQTCQKLQSSASNHPWTGQICAKTSTLPLTPGDVFPDFDLPLMSGNTTSLHTLLGENLTLVDLWASWCAPCRNENKQTLVPLWDQYHTKGFQIIGYALDASEKGWKNAILKDGADRWIHASHLKGDESPLFEKLKITTIPANYLLDAKGTILAKNLHGDELNKWVSEYLNL